MNGFSIFADENLDMAFPVTAGLLLLSTENLGFRVLKLITPPMASLPYITEPGPKRMSVFSIALASSDMTFCKLPDRKIALFIRTPSTTSKTLLVAMPLSIGEPPPNWLFWMKA
jgi:hypothetical protein